MTDSNEKIDWFWAHRRNSTLHHFSFLMQGLAGKGWQPAINFWFDNQIVIGVPNKGCYVFYDKNQLTSKAKYKDIQESIDNNPNFVKDFQTRANEIFGAIFFKCIQIDEENLSLLSIDELADIYHNFLQSVMTGPIITVQLWGIEACFDGDYKIMKFLKNRLTELDQLKNLQFYKEVLSVNTGETVALTEQKNFYQVVIALDQPKIVKIFKNKNIKKIINELERHPQENNFIEKHIQKYAWLSTEYVSEGWSHEKWIELFRTALLSETRPQQKLDQILNRFQDLIIQNKKVIQSLNPPADILHALNGLAELISQRDWAKGYFTKILLSYHKLLDEIAQRMGLKITDLFSYSYQEVNHFFETGEIIPENTLMERQKNGFAILIKHGNLKIYEGKDTITEIIENEGISEPFDKLVNMTSFKGLPASGGIITGYARVIEDASKLSELKDGEILITYMTTIEFAPAFRKIAGVVTDEGGMSCHAAIISREFKLPCVVGTKVATRVVFTGDKIEVDGSTGLIKIIEPRTEI